MIWREQGIERESPEANKESYKSLATEAKKPNRKN